MWAGIVTLFGWIVNGLSAAGTAIASAAMSVAIAAANAIKATAHVVSVFGTHAWGFLRDTWDKVLKPSLEKIFLHPIQSLKDLWDRVLKPIGVKFNHWIDKAHEWLTTKFCPIVTWLGKARKFLNNVWDRFLKPILQVIDVARAVLKILSQLGIDWAKRLDAKLDALEAWITGKLGEAFARLATAEGWINQIVDGFGLFQRVILLKSLFRDAGEAWNVLVGAGSRPVEGADRVKVFEGDPPDVRADVVASIGAYLEGGGGPDAEAIRDAGVLWRGYLETA